MTAEQIFLYGVDVFVIYSQLNWEIINFKQFV